jgi:hypothetical protein
LPKIVVTVQLSEKKTLPKIVVGVKLKQRLKDVKEDVCSGRVVDLLVDSVK